MPQLLMQPEPGSRIILHCGDTLGFGLKGVPEGWSARLRTNLGRADRQRAEIIEARFSTRPLANASWRDIPLVELGHGTWQMTLPVTEVGHFQAKPYAMDPRGFQHWPDGPDIQINVHPSWTRTSHPIYCAFPRTFGPTKERRRTADPDLDKQLRVWDESGYTVIPPSGTLRDVGRALPHIFDRLGCRLLHLLPVSPTPTTFARFGRFGSPYALQDLTAIDPALVEFDKRTTGIQQFEELAYAVHERNGRLMLDLVINHTGWGSRLWEEHPEWFLRRPNGEFKSPGAWDVVWEDLVELDQRHPALWDHLADAFLTWCRRGVDAFRCDAGYQVPTHVWKHITARVRQEFPDSVFLLEGLGGPWQATESLLSEGGMQWAYSELFQNFSTEAVTGYLDHSLKFGQTVGTLVNYSETHDNRRLAAHPTPPPAALLDSAGEKAEKEDLPNILWSTHRNRLCALTSVHGAFGFTNGVEWAATEQINVHSARGMAWGSEPNLVQELARLNGLLREHPCFFAGAQLTRISGDSSKIYALRRVSVEGLDSVLVLINTDFNGAQSLRVTPELWAQYHGFVHDLIGSGTPSFQQRTSPPGQSWVEVTLTPGAIHCLASHAIPVGLHGDRYRHARARADWAMSAWWATRLERPTSALFSLPSNDWNALSEEVDRNPAAFLHRTLGVAGDYSPVILWRAADQGRIVLVPPHHWLLICDPFPFRATVQTGGDKLPIRLEGIQTLTGWVAAVPPEKLHPPGIGRIALERFRVRPVSLSGTFEILPESPNQEPGLPCDPLSSLVLLTNGRGSMSRLQVDLGSIRSKYDCLLGANLNPALPVDRHVFLKRLRVWVDADGFISQLDASRLAEFEPGPPAAWRFIAPSGDGRFIAVRLVVELLPDANTVVMAFSRSEAKPDEAKGSRPIPPDCRVSLTVRLDLEDRSFHAETKFNAAADAHFSSHYHPSSDHPAHPSDPIRGFAFTPAADRQLRVVANSGQFHPQPEWSFTIPHPVEASRGQEGAGDAYSPGWFELPLLSEGAVTLVATAEAAFPGPEILQTFVSQREILLSKAIERASLPAEDRFGNTLVKAVQAYIVRRDTTRSIIAGYPWFLDWGRDSLIAARGLLAAGLDAEVRELLVTFARFEDSGTLPNSIHGSDASNRDTSDAPLWFGVVCEEAAARLAPELREAFYSTPIDLNRRTLDQVLRDLACGYLKGPPNGIQVDAKSGLVWSPSHFTWMDTNHPAGTPREGYPIEIQALWIRLLRHLAARQAAPWEGRGESWSDLARRAEKSLHLYFWLDEPGWYADALIAARGVDARMSAPTDALRNNCLFLISLDINQHPDFRNRARRMVDAATRHLVVPGALRTLAPLPVIPPLPILGRDGRPLNDPDHPYWPRYEGDEDTRRKPAYHNGTAWLWTFPTWVESLVKAHPGDPSARAAAIAYMASIEPYLNTSCLGQLPEIVDGDFPHTQRGCDAQAWSVTEALRVWKWLSTGGSQEPNVET